MNQSIVGVPAFAVLSLAGLAALAGPTTEVVADECGAAGDYAFVCGIPNAEDLVQVPGTKWIISSGLAPGAGLYLVDAQEKSWSALYPGEAPRAAQDVRTFGACPGAPDPASLVTHGLALRPGANGRSTLYVVGHGGREAIEIFDVDASGERPTLTWNGCVLTPEGMEANSVASLPDGSLLVTIPLLTGVPIGEALAGNNTGGVYRWSPGDAGFIAVEGTEQPYANGIEVSADGEEFYVASSGLFTVTAYSNTNPARRLRSTEAFGFVPDNLHMGRDGRLVTGGRPGVQAGRGARHRARGQALQQHHHGAPSERRTVDRFVRVRPDRRASAARSGSRARGPHC